MISELYQEDSIDNLRIKVSQILSKQLLVVMY